MSDVFISYSRKDIAFARLVHSVLKENGFDTWIDWQDIPPSADWMAEVYEAIEAANTFIFIISETSVASEVCGREIEHAVQNNKRLIPIVIQDIDPSKVQPALRALNWIIFKDQEQVFQRAAKDLIVALEIDLEWVKAHTRYQIRALEWERNKYAGAYLLQGEELEEAEDWLLSESPKDSSPTELQREYILACRQSLARRQRFIFGGVAVGLVLALAVSIFAIVQRGIAIDQRDQQATAEGIAVIERDARATAQAESQNQRDVAVSQYLASQASALTRYNLQTKMLLSVEALRFYAGVEARSSLLEALLAEPHLAGILLQNQGIQVQSSALSEDGTRLVVGGLNGEILLLDTQTGKLLAHMSLEDASSSIDRLTFSADATTLISVDADQNVLAWDLTPEIPQSRVISDYQDWDRFLAVNFDGSEMAACSASGGVMIWSTDTGEILQSLEGSGDEDTPLIFSPDGMLLAAFHEFQQVRIWDRATGEVRYQYLKLPENAAESAYRTPLNAQYTLAFNPENDALIFATGHQTYFWDLATEDIVEAAASYDSGFDANGTPMALSHSRFEPFQREILSGKITEGPLQYGLGSDPFAGELLGFAWTPLSDGVILIWEDVGNDTLILRYAFNQPIPIRQQIPDSQGFDTVAHVPIVGSTLMITAGCADEVGVTCIRGSIQFWDSTTGESLGDPIIAHDDTILSVAISPDGETFATASLDGTLQLWDLATRSPKGAPIVVEKETQVDRLRFHPSGSMLALRAGMGNGNAIYFIDLESHEILVDPLLVFYEGEADSVYDFAFAPNGTLMAITQGKLGLTYWDINQIEAPTMLKNIDLETIPRSVVFHPAGSMLAAGMNGAAAIVEVETGEILLAVERDHINRRGVIGTIYSPDGDWLVAFNNDDTVQLLDGSSGVPIGSPLIGLHDISIYRDSLAFTPDGTRLITVNQWRDILIWDLDVDVWQQIGCSLVNTSLSPEQWTSYLGDMEYRETCP